MEKLKNLQLKFNCPKSIDEMLPCNGGLYCKGCHKIVHDFRGMDEARIDNFINGVGGKVCGLFEADRISVNVNATTYGWKKWASAAMVALGFTALHEKLLAQQAPSQTQKADTTDLNMSRRYTLGKVAIFNRPQYPTGDAGFREYIKSKVQYPEDLPRNAQIEFIVENDGTLSHIKLVNYRNREFANQIIAALKNCPKWIPAQPNYAQQNYTVALKP